MNRILKEKPYYVNARLGLYEIFMQKKMYKECINELKQAIDYQPDNFKCYFSLANTYVFMNQIENAIDSLEYAFKLASPEFHSTIKKNIENAKEFDILKENPRFQELLK